MSGGPRAMQALTPTVLAMIGRSLIEWGEIAALFEVSDGSPGGAEFYLVPAQHEWTVLAAPTPKSGSWTPR